MTNETNTSDWYRQAVVYQIYPRSFADANGDGIGDLAGIVDHVDHLVRLGVDAVWLSPFYPSALADGGYDVDDYRNVDPRLGTLADFDRLVDALHSHGIRLIVDIVPNHTGSGHELFRKALADGPGSPARELYHFRDGDEPPTDWTSAFGGSAWQQVDDGQWYLHMFDVTQPDLNWDHPEVVAEFDQTLRFWADRGVDGFRVDVAHLLKKDLSEPLPSQAELDAADRTVGNGRLEDRDEVHDIYRHWRQIFNEYDPPRVAVAEAWVPANRRPSYATREELGQAFNFDLLQAPFRAEELRRIIDDNLALAARSGSSTTWVLSNHDVVRHATRYGLPEELRDGRQYVLGDGHTIACDADLGLRRALAATLLILALPGSTYLYQGEELGLPQVVDIADEYRQDPTFFRSPGVDKGRDGCRVPLPWTPDGPSLGFGSGEPHLPQPTRFRDLAVSRQDADSRSPLNVYRRALRLRAQLQDGEDMEWLDSPQGTVALRRHDGWVCVANLTSTPIDLPSGEVLLTSADLVSGKLPEATTVWLRPR